MTIEKNYGLFVQTSRTFADSADMLRKSLASEGFGIQFELDISRAMKEKAGKEMPPYLILGACNPQLAAQALTEEPDIGLLLPCNFIVREENGKVVVGGILPQALLSLTGRSDMASMAGQVREMIEKVLSRIE